MSHAQLSILTRKRQARGVKGRLGHPLCRPLSLWPGDIFVGAGRDLRGEQAQKARERVMVIECG